MGRFVEVYFLIQVELVELYLQRVVENYGLFSFCCYCWKKIAVHNDLENLEVHLKHV